ncbi:hypothetical protein KFL_000020410 [Klebsormidium nitens]|uniref:Transmembrane protein n=1 Tax=Klebsormidium nitens TaxID=105231 RepID=A0A1Y1HKL6_KLENI|nr:hypothetical protein KFL_000020410 [Klebsormidium nitens]|eukprot:GAQ77679.1 hypothetical protein KFL_000020410 [Klebsormidium nitens]
MPVHGLVRVSPFAIALVLITFSVNGAEAGSGLSGRKLLDTNLAAGDVDVSCNGLAPISILRSVQDIPAAVQDVVSAAVPLYNNNQHGAAACVYESLLWELIRSPWLSGSDPVFLLATRTLNVSQTLARGRLSVWPVKQGTDFVGSVVVGRGVTAGGVNPTAAASGTTPGSSNSTSMVSNGIGLAQALNAGTNNASQTETNQGTSQGAIANGSSYASTDSSSSSNAGQVEPSDQTRSWVIRWAMEALVGWGDVVGACNAMAGSAHSQQALQIAGYLREKFPEQCALSLLVATEQLRVVCTAAAAALSSPKPRMPANLAAILAAGGSNPSVSSPTSPSSPSSTAQSASYRNIQALVSTLADRIGQTPSQSPGERMYVLADVISLASKATLTDTSGTQSSPGVRAPPTAWTFGNSPTNNCLKTQGCTSASTTSIVETWLFSFGGLLGLLILGLAMCILIRRHRRNRLLSESSGASITPVDVPAVDGPPEDPTVLKSPLARALRAITVWLPGGLAAIAYEERKPQPDPEAGSPAATPRTPKDP